MAKEIRHVFLTVRAQYVPNARGGFNIDPYIKAARLCKESGETPTEFVMRQVPEMATRGVWYPTALASAEVMEARIAKQEDVVEDALAWYQFQLAVFASRITLFSPKLALEDPTAPFSPLFRCVMGTRYGFPELLDQFREDARLELSAYPIAKDIFGDEVTKI